MDIMGLLGSKATMAIIGVAMTALTWGGMKVEIWRLQGKLAKAQTELSQAKTKHQACTSDLGELRISFFRQNERIDQLKNEAIELAVAADLRATRAMVSPEKVQEEARKTPPGHVGMNRFISDLLEEGS